MEKLEKLKNIFTKYKDQILFFTGSMIIIGVIIFYIIPPQINTMNTTNNKIEQINSDLNKKKIEKQSMIAQQNSKAVSMKSMPAIIYKSPYSGMSAESASIGLVDGLVQMIKSSGLRIIEISNQSAKDSSTASHAASQSTQQNSNDKSYGSLNLTFSLRGTFQSVRSLLEKIYTWQYLVAIKEIDVDPEQGNPDNLSIKITVILYVQNT